MHIENRAAENGGEIIDNTTQRTYQDGKQPVMLVAIVESVINTVTSPNMTNIAYYNGKTLAAGDVLYAKIATVQLTSGAVQAVY